MSETGASTAILSLSAPGVVVLGENGSAESSKIARQVNEYAAKLRDSKPEKFGFFATVPSLVDVDAALAELRYAFDELHADGVTLLTRYGDGKNWYLGNKRFEPIWEELNKRSAVVFIHPTHAVDTELVNEFSPQPMYDYPHETLRTAMDLILMGNRRKFPQTKVILSHAGGTLPYLVNRVGGMFPYMFPKSGVTKESIEQDAKSFYFDTALAGTSNILGLLLDWAPDGHVLFGGDFPYCPSEGIVDYTKNLDEYSMNDELREKIAYKNAQALFPRLQASS